MVCTWIISLALNSLAPPLWLSSPLLAAIYNNPKDTELVSGPNQAQQRAEMQELRQKIQQCETDKSDMIVKLAGAQAKITILEARVGLLENGVSGH